MSYPGVDVFAGLPAGPSGPARFWSRLRAWDGSQQRAFEELCFQLRDPAPDGWQTIKTAAPDGGVEWYDIAALAENLIRAGQVMLPTSSPSA